MYEYIKGKIVSKQADSYRGAYIVIEAGGIGYFASAGKNTISELNVNDEIKIYVSLSHKEDSMSLTGFITKEERDIFNILRSVPGIGIKTALMILDEFSIPELINIMIREDAKELSRTKGVGAKSAQKIIIELKDKLINWSNVMPVDITDIDIKDIPQETVMEVQSVLVSLGYSVNEAKSAVKEVLKYKKDNTNTEDILKHSLEYLSRTA